MGYNKKMTLDASTTPVGTPRPSFASTSRPPRQSRIGSADQDGHLHGPGRHLPGKSSQARQPSDGGLGKRAIPKPRR